MVRAIQLTRQRSAARIADDAGFSMVELVVAMFIFALVIGGIVAGMSTSLNLTRQNRQRSIAANLAAQEMDKIRSTDFETLPLGLTTTTEAVGGVNFTVSRTTQYVTQSALSGTCGVTAGSKLQYLSLLVSITWVNMGSVQPVTSATVLAAPPGTGNIEATVVAADGVTPVSNVTITVTDSSNNTKSAVTTANGCAFFASLSPDTYTVTASRTGYVDYQGTSAPSQEIAVYTDGIYNAQFDYDQAGTANLTIAGLSGATVPAAIQNAPVTLGNALLLPSGTKTFGGTGTPRAIPNVFPFNGGYTAWVGSCLDAKPATGATSISVPPGGSGSGTAQLPRITVQTRQSNGTTPRTNVAITATHLADAGCGSGATYALGSTNATTGNLTTVALPYGLWTISAAGQSGSTVCTGGTPTGQCKVTLVAGGSGATSVPTLMIRW